MTIVRNALIGGTVLGSALLWLTRDQLPMVNKKPPLQPVPKLDMNRFAGGWYEIAMVPYFFEKKNQRDAFTRYRFVDNNHTFEDYFQARKPDGSLKTFVGRLRSKGFPNTPNNAVNGDFRSTFIKFFNWQYWLGVNYLVVGLGKNYDYAVISLPSRKLNWIFSRTPNLNRTQLREISQTLKAQQINPCNMLTIPQTGGLQKSQPFCEILKQADTN